MREIALHCRGVRARARPYGWRRARDRLPDRELPGFRQRREDQAGPRKTIWHLSRGREPGETDLRRARERRPIERTKRGGYFPPGWCTGGHGLLQRLRSALAAGGPPPSA